MPSATDFLRQQPTFLCLVNGLPDSGKSDLAMSFPGCYVITFDPTGFQILRNNSERSRRLAANLVHIEPGTDVWGPNLFRQTIKGAKKEDKPQPVDSSHRDSIYGCFAHVVELAKAGSVQTLILDGFNYLVGEKWKRICADPVHIAPSGELDRFAAYRALKLFLDQFTWATLLPLAIRNSLNLVVTCHIKRESEEAVTGVDAKGVRKATGKVSQDSNLAPIIEGSFRNEIDGKFGAVIYLEHRPIIRKVQKPGTTEFINVAGMEFFAYCQKVVVPTFGTAVNAKNKYGMPARLNITDKNFYEILLSKVAQPELQAATVEAAK